MDKKYLNVEDFVSKIKELPVLPENIQKINELISREDTTIDDVAKFIQAEPSLTLRLLKIANSAFYGRIGKVYNIKEAIVVVGLGNLKSLLLSIFIEQFYNNPNNEDMLKNLWAHSVLTALISSKIIEYYSPEQKELAYTSGLLHDIGEFFLFKNEFDLYINTVNEIKLENLLNRITIEEFNIGFSHNDLGAFIAGYWNLPRLIKEAIFHHHYYDTNDYYNFLVPVVQLADILAIKIGFGGSDFVTDNLKSDNFLNKKLINHLKLTREQIDLFLQDTINIKNNLSSLLEALK